MADTDRGYVSQYSQENVGVAILVGSTPTDADGPVMVTFTETDTGGLIFTRTADHVGTGTYQVTLTPDDTAALGNYTATWSYLLGGDQKTFNAYFAIGGAEPAYDQLTDDLKSIVDSVWIRMADMFDSPSGGSNLQTWAQTNFTRGRIAQLMRIAVGRLNTIAQPASTYSIDPGGKAFPTVQWGPLLEQLTWIETVRHLARSFLEQPNFEGASISRLDRQAYYDRYTALAADEDERVKDQLSVFKMNQMFLGRPSVLLSGGAFGRMGGMNRAASIAARGRLQFANYWG